MSEIEIHCKHCGNTIESSTIDQAYRWLHEETGNAFCDVTGPADAVANAGQPDRTLAEPDADKLYTDAEEALDATYTLNYVSYDDRLTPSQLQVLLNDENPWESSEFSDFEEWESDAGYHRTMEIIGELLTEEQREILEQPQSKQGFKGDGTPMTYTTDRLDDLRFTIQDRDDSDLLGGCLDNMSDTLFRYDLDYAVPDWTMLQGNDERREAMRAIAEAAGLSVLDRKVIRQLRNLLANAPGGGTLYAMWYGSPKDAIELSKPIAWDYDKGGEPVTDPVGTVTFSGATLQIINHWEGSGYGEEVETMTVPWVPLKVSIDAPKAGPGYSWHEIAYPSPRGYSATFTVNRPEDKADEL
jgi:hypothetical protein